MSAVIEKVKGMSRERASIIIPAYNMKGYIEAAIRSAQEQTERAIEILVVDDCSEDETFAIAQHLAAQDPRIRMFRTPENGGPSVALNLGLQHARGDWIVILGADDRFHPERVATLIEFGERVGADLIVDNAMIIDESGLEPPWPMLGPDVVPCPREITFTEFMERSLGSRRVPRGVNWGGLKAVCRHEFLSFHGVKWDTATRVGEDHLHFVACFLRRATMWVTPQPMYYYTARRGSLTDNVRLADLWRIVQIDRQLLSNSIVRSDPRLLHAVHRHLEAYERWFYYRRFADAAKARKFGRAWKFLFENLDSLRHVAAEAAIQTPRVIGKSLRGRYGTGPSKK